MLNLKLNKINTYQTIITTQSKYSILIKSIKKILQNPLNIYNSILIKKLNFRSLFDFLNQIE